MKATPVGPWLPYGVLLFAIFLMAGAAWGDELRNPSSGLCLDSFGQAGEVRMHPCHGNQGNQDWKFNPGSGEIRNPSSGLCLDSWGRAGSARMNACHGQGGNQQWKYNPNTGELRNPSSGLCLDSWGRAGAAIMHGCHAQRGNQQFLTSAEPQDAKADQWVRIVSRYQSDLQLHQSGADASVAAADSPRLGRGDWMVEPVADGYVRLKHRATGNYLHAERGRPEIGRIRPEWWSAMWQLERVEGDFVRILNRHTGGYLHNQRAGGAQLTLGDIESGWWSAMWSLQPVRVTHASVPTPRTPAARNPTASTPTVRTPVSRPLMPNAPEPTPQPVEDIVDRSPEVIVDLYQGLNPVPGLARPRSNLGGKVDVGFGANNLAGQLSDRIRRANPITLPKLETAFSWFEAVANSGGELGGALAGHIQSTTPVPGRGYLLLETPTDKGQRIGVLGFYDPSGKQLRTFEVARPPGCTGYPSNVDAAGDFFVIGWSGCRSQMYRLEGSSIEHLSRYDSPINGTEWKASIAWHQAHRKMYLYLGNALYRSSTSDPDEIAGNRCAVPGESGEGGQRPTCWQRVGLAEAPEQPANGREIIYEGTALVYDQSSANLALIYFGKAEDRAPSLFREHFGEGQNADLVGNYPELVTYQFLQFSGSASRPSVRFGPLKPLPLTYPFGQFGVNARFPVEPSFRWGGGAGIGSDGSLIIMISPRSMRVGPHPTRAVYAPTFWQTGVAERSLGEAILDTGRDAVNTGADLGQRGLDAADQASRPARDAVDREIARRVAATCPSGFKQTAVDCISTTCPGGSSLSDSGLHCLTGSTLAPPFGGCPASHPTRRGLNCHRSCGNLKTDSFGNCEVEKRPLQCPRGYSNEGPWCVKD